MYTARPDYERGVWVIDIDDLDDVTGLVVLVGGSAVTLYTLEPVNGVLKGTVWTRLVISADSSVQPTGAANEAAITGKWGWTTTPVPVGLAGRLQASRFASRRQSPYGVAGSPDQGSELRLLSRVDPDVGVSLRGYRRERVLRMNLAAVMQAISARLGTISGLRCFAYPEATLTPPGAMVLYPETIAFDETYGRGMDRMKLPLLVVVGKVSDRSARDQMGAYCDGSGASRSSRCWNPAPTPTFDTVVRGDVKFDVVNHRHRNTWRQFSSGHRWTWELSMAYSATITTGAGVATSGRRFRVERHRLPGRCWVATAAYLEIINGNASHGQHDHLRRECHAERRSGGGARAVLATATSKVFKITPRWVTRPRET
jgi:hypothetical protein